MSLFISAKFAFCFTLGQNPVRLTFDSCGDSHPQYSPDGRKIVLQYRSTFAYAYNMNRVAVAAMDHKQLRFNYLQDLM
jgi:Tol biopolymer transport system component